MQIWNKISYLGMTGKETFTQNKVIKLINQIYGIVLGIHLLVTPVALILKFQGLFVSFSVIMVCLGIIYLLLKKGKHKIAAYSLIFTETLFITYLSVLGYKGYFFLYIIPLFIIAMIIINNKRYNLTVAIILTCSFIGGAYLQNYFYDPLISDPKLSKLFFILNNISIILISIYAIFYYKLINEEYEGNLNIQKEKIENQHKTLISIHSDIKASIIYAKRIQNAILPPNRLINSYIAENFILYKPKEIIAGDFYWTEKNNDHILFAVADCNGHGVPGAMISVVCHNALNKSVREHHLTDPGEILDKTKDIISSSFKFSNDNKMDGMDITLISIYSKNKLNKTIELKYAGAKRPLVYVKNNKLTAIKANRHQIGNSQTNEKYTTHTVELSKNDMIYLYSDGYASQFNEKTNKKLKERAFKALLLNVSSLDVQKQAEELDNFFTQWKGKLNQLDDVCVVGIKV